uniref:CSON012860 protein n=1 Tax=Culicoides sonorensis TaxID=179676 RepID=A0A336LZR8_CULSO
MNFTTKTGLIASPRKQVYRYTKSFDPLSLAPCAITKQVSFSLRPFGGLFNPYSKGCSVLCNHPASVEVKSVVKKAKDAWICDGRAISLRSGASSRRDKHHDGLDSDLPEHVPEEFFRRYTDTDSRPLTPTPTMVSGKTRTNQGANSTFNRRCVTPEPVSSHVKERKQLILDLRRSHSQDVFAVSDLSPTQLQDTFGAWTQQEETRIHTVEEHPDENESEPPAPYDRFSHTPSSAHLRTNNIVSDQVDEASQKVEQICINELDDPDDEDNPRRRGKKRKKSSKPVTTHTFQASQDPETHITTLAPDDTPNASARASFSLPFNSGSMQLLNNMQRATFEIVEEDNSEFFLDEQSLKLLRRGLNIDLVEEVFDRYKHRAMKEALRLTAPGKIESEAVKELREQLQLPEVDHEKWMELPRKYTRASARFGLPMDTRELSKLTPLQYLSKHVSVLSDRKQLYHRIFVRNLSTQTDRQKSGSDSEDDDDYRESDAKEKAELVRTLSYSVLNKAMHEVLGFHGKPDKISKIRDLLGLTGDVNGNEIPIDFRTWCGIVAFSERYLTDLDKDLDPCNEIEIADFESLDRRIKNVEGNEKLINVLYIIKNN